MPMSIQRQADQYDLDVPSVEHVARHEIEDLLKPAFRLRPNTNNPREAGREEGDLWGNNPFPPLRGGTTPEGEHWDQDLPQKRPDEDYRPRHDGTHRDWGPEGDGLPRGFDRQSGAHTLDRDTYFNSDTFMGPRQRSEPTLTRAMPFESEDADEAPLVMRKSPGKPGAPRHRAASATFGDVLPPFLVR